MAPGQEGLERFQPQPQAHGNQPPRSRLAPWGQPRLPPLQQTSNSFLFSCWRVPPWSSWCLFAIGSSEKIIQSMLPGLGQVSRLSFGTQSCLFPECRLSRVVREANTLSSLPEFWHTLSTGLGLTWDMMDQPASVLLGSYAQTCC